ncbi:hypothetical protein [Deefgea salmonis]|uniref:Uncharacterized protein n=1 Tax=Deefgea salmonis TaxID=2875502 RepID=A0ABS8BNA3_9NEIS|nr:hypothetical protein [Deefgea salmonis]MCB5197207.1 hypothetical protein [Deefgea salmonis]
MSTKQKYWFPAKRYGWGWGMPSSWQGWCVLLAYLMLLILAVILKLPDHQPLLFWSGFGLLSLIFLIICWRKGEPTQWRWGEK